MLSPRAALGRYQSFKEAYTLQVNLLDQILVATIYFVNAGFHIMSCANKVLAHIQD